MKSQKKLQVFISSTFIDLKDERQAAVEAILKAGHIPAGMELFTASNKSQWDIIKKWIDESDIYMLILGGRYGSIEQESGKSYTHLEYEYAQSINKPLFAVVIEESALGSRRADNIEKVNPDKLQDFRDKVLSYMSSFFKEIKDIKLAVHESMGQITQDYELAGWIRGNNQSSNFANEMLILNDEMRKLREENERLKAKRVIRLPEILVSINQSQGTDFSFSADDSKFYKPQRPIKELPEHLISYISQEDINSYNDWLNNITDEDITRFNRIQTKISALLNNKEPLIIKISNLGNTKAQSININITFPKFVYISKSRKQIIDAVSKLAGEALHILPTQGIDLVEDAKEKYRYDSRSELQKNLQIIVENTASKNKIISGNTLDRLNINSNHLIRTNENDDYVKDNKIVIKKSNLMHNLDLSYEDYFLVPLEKGEGTIKVEVLCEEYLDTKIYEIPITVS